MSVGSNHLSSPVDQRRLFGPSCPGIAYRWPTVLVTLALVTTAGRLQAQPGPLVPCDIDEDNDVDLDDYSALFSCHTGPAATHDGTQTCAFADSNGDGHVDGRDFGNLQACFSGAGNPADSDCAARPIAIALDGACIGGSLPDPSQAPGPDLHKVTIDAADAICNDGSPGVFYIRRAVDAAHLNGWVFHIEAGGSCTDFESCMERWCGFGPVHTAAKMSSNWAHNSITVQGIFNRAGSALAANNLVYFYYCSSDQWSGGRSNALLTSQADPTQSYSMHFRGHRILEAALNMLLSGPVTSDSGAETVPPLGNATEVLVTGTSAGANGTRFNVDWIASHFDPAVTNVRTVLDAGLTPSTEVLDDPILVQLVEDNTRQGAELQSDLYHPFWDQSCVQMLGGTPDWWRCVSATYVTLNHITTPFFQRMDITDSRSAGTFLAEYGVPLDAFADGVIASLALLPDIDTTAAEAGQINFVPGVYGSNCSQHVALTTNNYFLISTLDDANSIPHTFDQALRAWLMGADVFIVDEHPAQTSTCP
ncbi:MAG: hypothetical protein GY778_06840 [bacterium]|nr:hypothetical protein [bacterium]